MTRLGRLRGAARAAALLTAPTHAADPPLDRTVLPAGTPNVVIIRIDDLGFGAGAPFGGPLLVFSGDETADVGIDLSTPVVEALRAEARSRFTGRIPKMTIAVREATAIADAAVHRAHHDVTQRTE